MRILLVHNYYRIRGGEDVVFETERDMLIEKGHEVETFTVKSKDDMNTVEKLGTALSGFYNHKTARELALVIAKFKPDIMHVHNFFPLLSPAVFDIADKMNVPTIMTLHNFRLVCPQGLMMRDNKPCTDCLSSTIAWPGIKNKCYQESNIATAINTGIINLAKVQGVWHHKLTKYIILNPYVKNVLQKSTLNIPDEKFIIKPNSTPEYGCSFDKEPYVLFVGRLSQEKGIEHLLEAFKELPNIKLKIAGTGPLESLVKDASQTYTNIDYLGFQPRENVMSLLKSASALIFTSVCLENCPMSILESFSVATPVIAGNTDSVRYFVEHNQNGLLYDTGNPASLQESVRTFFSGNINRNSLMENARRTWESRFSPEIGYNGLISAYTEALTVQNKG